MVRIILGVIVGFCVWSILWIGGNQILSALSPGWYGAQEMAVQKALASKTPFTDADTVILLMHLALSMVVSFISGFIAALVAGENKRTTFWLSVALILFGLLVTFIGWDYLPAWYYVVFLILLMPVTIAGGKLRRVS